MEHATASRNRVKEVLAAWDIGAAQAIVDIHPGEVYKVECVTGTSFVLKNIGEQGPQTVARFQFEHQVLRHLDSTGISVALPIPNQEGELLVLRNGNLYTLSPYLTANNKWLELDLEGLRRLNRNCGAAIARLHVALATFPAQDLENRTWKTVLPDDLFDHWIPSIRQNISQQERGEFETIVADIAADMRVTMEDLPTQLIHRDCHHGNIIVDEDQVSGFIDYDHLSIGPRIFDLADFIVHMIKQHVADRERTSEWYDLFPAVLQGYDEENPLLEDEKQALCYVMLGVLLIFAGWLFEVARPEKAQPELEAFAWMYHNRQRIRDRIVTVRAVGNP